MTLEVLDQDSEDSHPFGEYEEEAIVALMLDHPDLFVSLTHHLSYKLFQKHAVQYVVQNILNYYEKYEIFPTRNLLIDIIKNDLTVDDVGYEEILEIASKESDPREVPALKDRLLDWARSKSYGLLYDEETIRMYNDGNYDGLEKIIEDARHIQDFGKKGFWFFDNIEKLFVEEEVEHYTTGFPQLDKYINDGGPSKKEMLVWMAPTGVGKSIVLCNNAAANVLRGHNVLYVTLELSDLKSALRTMGALTGQPIGKARISMREAILKMVHRVKTDGAGDLVIYEYPPDEISVNHLYALIDNLHKTKNWRPDVVILDYLELMRSRNESDNKDDYSKQKAASTQIRGLAINENVLVYTATQTNRGGNDTDLIDVTKMAESYGKSMPMDYLVSINQSKDEYDAQFGDSGVTVRPAQARMYIAKSRNGVKFKSIPISINYSTMKAKELL